MKEPVDARISFAGLIAAVVAVVYILIRFHANLPLLAAMLVYGASVCVLFGASSLYHGIPASTARTAILRKVDHAIYVLIAGSYTPVLFVGLTGAWRIATLAAIWGVAVGGVTLSIWFIHAPRWLSATVYVAMGWFAVVPAFKLVPTLPPMVTLLIAAGGVLYTVGAIVYATRKLDILPRRFGFHEIFHVFVLAGATAQFVGIAGFLVPA